MQSFEQNDCPFDALSGRRLAHCRHLFSVLGFFQVISGCVQVRVVMFSPYCAFYFFTLLAFLTSESEKESEKNH
jgi:hypothetical protein